MCRHSTAMHRKTCFLLLFIKIFISLWAEALTKYPCLFAEAGNTGITPPPPLQYRDVFVLTGSKSLQDEVKDDAGRVTSLASGVVSGLRESGIPVLVIRECPESRPHVLDTALAGSDMVTVAYYGSVHGLERKVVVWLPHKNQGEDDKKSDEKMKARGRFCAMSRCTSQLVEVVVPLPNEQPTSEDNSQ